MNDNEPTYVSIATIGNYGPGPDIVNIIYAGQNIDAAFESFQRCVKTDHDTGKISFYGTRWDVAKYVNGQKIETKTHFVSKSKYKAWMQDRTFNK